MKRWLTLGLLLAAAVALALRLPQLDKRPLHADESVHATKFAGLWEHGVYKYDPNEYHGPVLYYATLPFAWLSSARTSTQLRESTLRLVTVCFGVAMILALPLLANGLGRKATLCAAALTAVSPAMVFYSRYYIHELPLVFFTLLLLGALWRYSQTQRLGWALLAGAALGLMHATKETFVFNVAALVTAGIFTLAWERWVERAPIRPARMFNRTHIAAALLVGGSISLLLFSSFFTNAAGPLDSLRTYLPWLNRAFGASPHIHPWYYYLQRLAFFHPLPNGPIWSEGLILGLAVAGLVAAFRPGVVLEGNSVFVRFIGFYTLVLTGLYCLIAYKTPWCLLGFHHGFILLAGVGAVALTGAARAAWWRIPVALALGLATAQLGWQAWRASYPLCADRQNPYVYAHTSVDLLRLVAKLEAVAKSDAAGDQVVIKVMAPGGDYWPLPWYLRRFKQVGWWPAIPADPYAPLMIVGARFDASFDEKSAKKWLMVGLFELRPKTFLELYVEFGLWKKYIESLPPRRDDDE